MSDLIKYLILRDYIIPVAIIVLIIVIIFIKSIINELKKIGKKNCYNCKYYKLSNVASVGDGCWYKCTKHNREDSWCSMNEKEHYEKCKYFKGDK